MNPIIKYFILLYLWYHIFKLSYIASQTHNMFLLMAAIGAAYAALRIFPVFKDIKDKK